MKKVNHRTGPAGHDEFGGKAYSALSTILKKTDSFLEKPNSNKDPKALGAFFYAAFRGKKDASLAKAPVSLVVDASYIRYGALEKAFHG